MQNCAAGIVSEDFLIVFDGLFFVPYSPYTQDMRFPWSRPKTTAEKPQTPPDSRRVIDDSVTAFFNTAAPKKSPLSELKPHKDTSPIWYPPGNRRADSAEQMAERRIRQWMMEQEAEERARLKFKKP